MILCITIIISLSNNWGQLIKKTCFSVTKFPWCGIWDWLKPLFLFHSVVKKTEEQFPGYWIRHLNRCNYFQTACYNFKEHWYIESTWFWIWEWLKYQKFHVSFSMHLALNSVTLFTFPNSPFYQTTMTMYNGFCTKCQLTVPLSSNKYSYILHVIENRNLFQNLDLGF